MATLNDWFNKKDYEEGLLLLARYSKNRMLIQNLGKRKNPGKLEYELKKFTDQLRIDIKKPVVKKATEAKKTSNKKVVVTEDPAPEGQRELKIIRGKRTINPDDLPVDIKKLWEGIRDSYKEIRALSEKLKLMEESAPEEREPFTARMVELDDLIRSNWDVIDAWEPGKKPEKKSNEDKIENIDHKRINANRKYISTNLKKLKDVVEKDKAEIIVENLQIRYDELKSAGEEIAPETLAELTKAGVK
jgi:hypothetical protein